MELAMKTMPKRAVSKTIEQVSLNLLLLTLGSILCAIAINGILIPNGFLSSGLTGMVLILHYLFPFLPISALYFLLNVPIRAGMKRSNIPSLIFRELSRVKQLIRQIDPQAFVVVSDTLEVMDRRIGNQPQY